MKSQHKHTYEFSIGELMDMLKEKIEDLPGDDYSWKLEIIEKHSVTTGPILSGKPDFVGLRLIAHK